MPRMAVHESVVHTIDWGNGGEVLVMSAVLLMAAARVAVGATSLTGHFEPPRRSTSRIQKDRQLWQSFRNSIRCLD
jgi:hypothetical protein